MSTYYFNVSGETKYLPSLKSYNFLSPCKSAFFVKIAILKYPMYKINSKIHKTSLKEIIWLLFNIDNKVDK